MSTSELSEYMRNLREIEQAAKPGWDAAGWVLTSTAPLGQATIHIRVEPRCFLTHPCMLPPGHEGDCQRGACTCPLCCPWKYAMRP